MSAIYRITAVFSLLLLLFADLSSALPLAPYPHANTLFESQQQQDDYRLTLGALKKINNQWRAEREQRISGLLQRQTLELDPGHTAEEVFDYYRQQLLQLGGRELFFCQARRCGSSYSWANIRFGIKQLYGLDRYQHYSAIELVRSAGEGPRTYVALYAVLRGNKRSYVQVDILTTEQQLAISSSPEVIVQRFAEGQAYRLPAEEGDAHLQSLLAALRLQRGLHINLVGHDFAGGDLLQQRQRSLQRAENWRRQLLEQGVAQERVETFGLGSLAPSGRRGDDPAYVEVVRAARQ